MVGRWCFVCFDCWFVLRLLRVFEFWVLWFWFWFAVRSGLGLFSHTVLLVVLCTYVFVVC